MTWLEHMPPLPLVPGAPVVVKRTEQPLIVVRVTVPGRVMVVDPLGDSTLVDATDRTYLIEKVFVTDLGDADLDHDVDVNDLNLWKASRFTAPTGWADGDFDGDVDTDVNDLNLWKSNRFTAYSSVVDLLA